MVKLLVKHDSKPIFMTSCLLRTFLEDICFTFSGGIWILSTWVNGVTERSGTGIQIGTLNSKTRNVGTSCLVHRDLQQIRIGWANRWFVVCCKNIYSYLKGQECVQRFVKARQTVKTFLYSRLFHFSILTSIFKNMKWIGTKGLFFQSCLDVRNSDLPLVN